MIFKRLEIQGFKSFPDKTLVEFGPGLTAVVGPNGSGKSNVVDALKWVLGEQNPRVLRASRMEECIFSGSATRRPISRAEVSITFDNTRGIIPLNASEVMITRRLYRTGESEYFINQAPCRLKDVRDLFLDTGVGKEAYSFVGQGRIDEILSARPEDRRGIFEEAAGIARYRERRREAELKLEDTERSLTRIRDLIYSLEAEEQALSGEASRAKAYLELRQQEAEWNRELELYEFTLARRRLEQALEQMQQGEVEVSGLSARVVALANTLLALDTRLQEQRALWQEAREAALSARLHVEQHQNQLGDMQKRCTELGAELALRQSQMAEARQLLSKSLEELAAVENEITEQNGAASGLLSELASLKALQAKLDEELKSLGSAASGNAQALEQVRLDRETLVNQKSNILTRRTGVADRLASVEDTCQRAKGRVDETGKMLGQLNAELNAGKRALADVLTRQASSARARELAANEQRELASRRDAIIQEIAGLESRRKTIAEIGDGSRGFQGGVTAVLEASRSGRLENVHGAVSQLLDVPEQYQNAVEAALGGAWQNIVTSTPEDAERAIEYLKAGRLGRVTCLPLSVIKPRHKRPEEQQASQSGGALGFAASLVHTEPKYRDLVEYLLGSVVVAKTLKDALRIARETRWSVRMVTLDGDQLSAGGAITGGALAKETRHIFSADDEQRRVQKSLEALRQELDNVDHALAEAKTKLESAEKALVAAREQYETISRDSAAREARRDQLSRQLTESQEDLGRLTSERDALRSELAVLGRDADHLEDLLDRVEAAYEENRGQDSTLQTGMAEKLAERDSLLAKIEELERAVGTAAAAMAGLKERRRVLAERQNERKQALDSAENALSAAELKNSETLRQVSELEAVLKQAVAVQADSESGAARLDAELKSFEEEQRKAQALEREQRALLDDARQRLEQVRIRLERARAEVESRATALGVDLSNVSQVPAARIKSRDEAQVQLDEIRNQLNGIGDVRVSAIDEYNRVSDRLNSLKSDQEDLALSRGDLEQLMAHIESVMAERFTETFARICAVFTGVFAEMFPGGEGRLVCLNPDRPLESGIEVELTLPGKRAQSINLLSGGERAMTAIALLLSVLTTKPTPFCLLDEIDAALDDQNIDRYIAILKRLTRDTQFVMITHSKETMVSADRLYGVTMQESGVSQILSVVMQNAAATTETGVEQ